MMVMMRMTKVLVGVGERATQEYIRSTVLLPSKDCLDGWWIFCRARRTTNKAELIHALLDARGSVPVDGASLQKQQQECC